MRYFYVLMRTQPVHTVATTVAVALHACEDALALGRRLQRVAHTQFGRKRQRQHIPSPHIMPLFHYDLTSFVNGTLPLGRFMVPAVFFCVFVCVWGAFAPEKKHYFFPAMCTMKPPPLALPAVVQFRGPLRAHSRNSFLRSSWSICIHRTAFGSDEISSD